MPRPPLLAAFTAAGVGGGRAGARLDGVWLTGFTAAGRGALAVTPAAGRRASGFTAAGVGGLTVWPTWAGAAGFTAAGVGALTVITRVGGDDLYPVGPNLARTDALRIGVVLHGLTELFAPEDLAGP